MVKNTTTSSDAAVEPLLSVRDLCVTYKGLAGNVQAVENLCFDIQPGEAVGLVGESGSGKSTVGLALMGLLPRKQTGISGTILFKGRSLTDAGPAEIRHVRGAEIGMIFQDPMTSLNPYLTVGRQITETPMAHGLDKSAARKLGLELLEVMQIPEPAAAFKCFPHQFSGGMRQRTMAASAFSGGPALLIADEPTTALDVITQDKVLRLMKSELTRRGMSLLLITHDLGIVAGICDRVVVMKEGKKVEEAPVSQLFAAPVDPYTQRLLAAVPRLDAAVKRPDCPADDPPEKVVEIDRLSVEFRSGKTVVPAVQEVSLDLFDGEILGLVGQSGSGKSTLARTVAGLIAPCAGSVQCLGTEVVAGKKRGLKDLRRQVQLIFQDPRASLNSRLTVEAILTEPLRNFRLLSKRERWPRIQELLDMVQLPSAWRNRYPHELSGGQCQRVGIARALAVNPRILLCDEPVSALDVSIQAEILDLLAALGKDLSLTMLFISHDLAVVKNFADRVAVMHRGRIVELKPAAELYDHAEHAYTKTLLAAIPVPDPGKYRL